MKTISIFNQKGGVGKTTSVVNLAVALSKLDKKVLVIDFDPQANTTTGLGFDKNELEKSIYKMFYDEGDNYKDYILKSQEGPYLIASENSLSGLEVELVSLDEEERLKMLSQIIEEIKKDFDIILIDCPPSLGLLSLNALVASDSIIIPIQTEYYALEGVSELLKTYQTIKESIKEDLEIEGVLLCMFDKDTDLSYEVVEEVKSFFKEKVFSTMIPRNIKLAEAPSFGKSVISYDEKSKGARAYLSLAKELVENVFGKKENLEKNSKIEEKNDNLNNAEIKNSEKTKEIRDEKSKEDKNIVKNDKKENSDETIVKKNKFSFNQNKLVNNEKRD
ncbi:ParA family protein [Anaerococcus obesiensis]|uniref:Sporulation initiation inhibitor protein Soj n=1 Tax=Anaerococcus obesiensis TaxID=1287640 RepID=A0A7T7ZWF1_9FIRM|nr:MULTISPECIES: ParA family protein [Anaerococcus]MDU0944981.1 ParA family protein [Anaerococcus vaginalis]MDU1030498.1 ParA family protein [Anaerococcus vaginalis]QQN56560.1 ParA family protein [Anaerococcus obesiensis]